jgi:DEAD/DEAH box helicase domain-containing protein
VRAPTKQRRRSDHFTYLDVEVQRTADEVGGFTTEATRQRGMAVAVTWQSENEEFRVYYEEDCQRLVDDVAAAECVVGFNCLRFDYEVIQGQTPFSIPPTLDLLDIISNSAGLRIPLTNLALATLGQGRSSDGNENTALWASGDQQRVIEECKQDVKTIRQLHEHLMEHGFVAYLDATGECQACRGHIANLLFMNLEEFIMLGPKVERTLKSLPWFMNAR